MSRKGWSPSSLETLGQCPQKWDFRYNQKLVSDDETAASLRFGRLWHKIQELYRLGVDDPCGTALGVLEWEDSSSPKEHRNAAKARLAFELYCERWAVGDYRTIHKTEHELVSPIWPDSLPSHCIVDLLVDWDANELQGVETWVVDYKTTSRLEFNWVQLYRLSNQFKQYVYTAQREYPAVTGLVLDLLHVTAGNKRGPTQADRAGIHFYRLPIRYTQYALDDWYANALCEQQLHAHYVKANVWPKRAPFACRVCEFATICDAQDAAIHAIVKSGYPQREDT